jgi:NADPH-dependent glutamate synthase beta subunit-like oxidoreductase
MSLKVAIVGSGPAGCYAAEKLVRDAPGTEVDILERMPVPYGLVRAGVAPDHQGTKAVSRVFERLFARSGVGLLGNVEVGRDVTLAELRRLYDAVVLATGAAIDRRLGIPGEGLAGVHGSGAFVAWYNGHPGGQTVPDLSAVRSVVVIGNGNVALDVARVLARTPAELERSDVPAAVEAAIAAAPLEEIRLVGRRDAGSTSFSVNELQELGTLARAEPVVEADALESAGKPSNPAALDVLRGFAARPPEGKPVRIRFHFGAVPAECAGNGRVERVHFTRRAGGELVLPADLVVTCIGYSAADCCTARAEGGVFANEDGRVGDGLYVVGWARRGPSGTIATNRVDSHAVAAKLLREVSASGRPGRKGLRALLAGRGVRVVDHEGWTRIDAAECARAAPGRVRAKFPTVEEMLAAAG